MESVGIFSVGEESQEDMQCPLNRCQPLSKMGSLQSVLRHHPPSSHVTAGKNENRKGGND